MAVGSQKANDATLDLPEAATWYIMAVGSQEANNAISKVRLRLKLLLVLQLCLRFSGSCRPSCTGSLVKTHFLFHACR